MAEIEVAGWSWCEGRKKLTVRLRPGENRINLAIGSAARGRERIAEVSLVVSGVR